MERNINVWLPLIWPPLETWPATQPCAPTGNRTGDPLVHSPHSTHWSTPAQGWNSLVLFSGLDICKDFCRTGISWAMSIHAFTSPSKWKIIVFQKRCTKFNIHKNECVLVVPCPHQYLLLVRFLSICQLTERKLESHCSLRLYFLDHQWDWTFFHVSHMHLFSQIMFIFVCFVHFSVLQPITNISVLSNYPIS